MNRKTLIWYEGRYMAALAYAVVYGCDLSVDQFAAAHCLDSDELDQLRAKLESHGVNV
jgi:hypothetical protein